MITEKILELLLYSICIAELANWLSWKMYPIQWAKQLFRLTWWGFDCPTCVSFWLALGFLYIYPSYFLVPLCTLWASIIEKVTKV